MSRLRGHSIYLVVWGAAYLERRRRDIWEGCGSLITPGGDSGGSPHLKHTETHGTYQWWPRHWRSRAGGWGRGGGGSLGGSGTTDNTTTHWTRARVQITETTIHPKILFCTWRALISPSHTHTKSTDLSRIIHEDIKTLHVISTLARMEIWPMKWLQHKSNESFHHMVRMWSAGVIEEEQEKARSVPKAGSVWTLKHVSHRFSYEWRNVETEKQNNVDMCNKLSWTYRLVILRLCGGSWRGDRYRSRRWGPRHHGRLDWGELMSGSILSRGRLLRRSSVGLCRSCWSRRLLPESLSEPVTKLLYGNL